MLKSRSPAGQGVGLAAHTVVENWAVILCSVKFSCTWWFVWVQPLNQALEEFGGRCLPETAVSPSAFSCLPALIDLTRS